VVRFPAEFKEALLGKQAFVLIAAPMSGRHKHDNPDDAPTMHRWTARHYVLTAVIVIVVMGMFAYSWS